ncbi:MAG: hypothetical protein CMJ28_06335 [Phycisphaerae bacterium]|nr:hypothetical protein [Phycisphaerae bacterium]
MKRCNQPKPSSVSPMAMDPHDPNLNPNSSAEPAGGFVESAFGDPELEAQLALHFADESSASGVDLSALASRVALASVEELPSRVYRSRTRRGASLQAAALLAFGLVALRLLGPASTEAPESSSMFVAAPIVLPETILADMDLLTRDMVVRERTFSNLSGVADFECELESLFPEGEFQCDS